MGGYRGERPVIDPDLFLALTVGALVGLTGLCIYLEGGLR